MKIKAFSSLGLCETQVQSGGEMTFHIIVCIKSVVTGAPSGVVKRTPQNSRLNPFDRPALEAALQMKERNKGRVSAITMGPAVSGEALAEALAMGVDRGVLISDPALGGSDTLVTSRVLAAAVKRIGKFDLLFFGTRTSDSDTGQVGPQTATLLGVPFISGVKHFDGQTGDWTVARGMDEWEETWRLSSPWAASIDQHAYVPRSIGLDSISQVFDHIDIEEWSLTDLDLAVEDVGLAGSPTRVVALKKLRHDRKCFMLEGDAQVQVAELVTHLNKAGVLA